MHDNETKNTNNWDRYTDGFWSGLKDEAEEIRRVRAEDCTEATLHALADRLRELRGKTAAAGALIPLIEAQHRKSVQWALERTLAETQKLDGQPFVNPAERQTLLHWLGQIVGLVEQGELAEAEAQVRHVEDRLERLRWDSAVVEFDVLLSGLEALRGDSTVN